MSPECSASLSLRHNELAAPTYPRNVDIIHRNGVTTPADYFLYLLEGRLWKTRSCQPRLTSGSAWIGLASIVIGGQCITAPQTTQTEGPDGELRCGRGLSGGMRDMDPAQGQLTEPPRRTTQYKPSVCRGIAEPSQDLTSQRTSGKHIKTTIRM